jgi:hypothetical protein
VVIVKSNIVAATTNPASGKPTPVAYARPLDVFPALVPMMAIASIQVRRAKDNP